MRYMTSFKEVTMLLHEAIEKYTKYVKVTRSAGTLRYLEGKTNIILTYLGDIECELIDQDVLLDFILIQRKRNPHITNRTINKYIQTIQQSIRYACKLDVPFAKLPVQQKIIQTIPDHIVHSIFRSFNVPKKNPLIMRNEIIFALLYETGVRLTELLSIKLSDIDFNVKSIHLKKTKTNNERYVFFTHKTGLLMQKYIYKVGIEDYLIIDFVTGDVLKDYAIESLCQRLAKKLDIKQSISPHKWRHTFATKFVEANGNMEVLRQIMGHSSLTTTQKYLHISKEKMQEEYAKIMYS